MTRTRLRQHALPLAAFVLAAAPPVAVAQIVETGEPSSPDQPLAPLPSSAPRPAVAPVVLDAAMARPRRSAEPVDVHFLAYRNNEHYSVRVRDLQCTTPCTLRLPPGSTQLHATGDAEFDSQFVVPHTDAQVRLATGAPSWYTTAGAVLLPSGFVVGGAFWAFGLLCGYSSTGCYVLNFAGWPIVGVTMIITGSVLLGMAGRLPPPDANRPEILDARARPRLRFTDFALGPTDRGATAMATFSF